MQVTFDIEDLKAFITSRSDEQEESYDSPQDNAYIILMSLLHFCFPKIGNEAATALRKHKWSLGEKQLDVYRAASDAAKAKMLKAQEEFRQAHPDMVKVSFNNGDNQ